VRAAEPRLVRGDGSAVPRGKARTGPEHRQRRTARRDRCGGRRVTGGPTAMTNPPGEGTSSERSTSPLTVHPAAPSILLVPVHDRHAAISPCRHPDYRKLHSEMPVNS
jgi:hypothetical protein